MFHRTGLTFGILFLFIGMSIIPSMGINILEKSTMSTLDGNTLYVGGSGEGNYTKIQDAIDNASDGDTVYVFDDSSPYNEFVWINESINLIGEDRNTTIIDGGGTGYVDVVYITVNNVSVNGFTIYNCSGWVGCGIFVYKASNVIISGNIFIDNFFGIDNPLSSNTTIFGNDFINNTVGIGVDGSRSIIKGNIITNHTFGIEMKTWFNVIEKNTIFLPKKPELPRNTWGIALSQGSSKNIIKENTIINHLWGIQCSSDSSNNIISENMITNHFFSISLFGSSDLEINGNTITNSYWYGMLLEDSANNNTIVRNTISNSSEYGIYLEYSFSNKIKENNFIENNISAYFENSLFNRWIRNYWERPKLLPYPIFGKMKLGNITIPWMNFDWRPALKPHDIIGGI